MDTNIPGFAGVPVPFFQSVAVLKITKLQFCQFGIQLTALHELIMVADSDNMATIYNNNSVHFFDCSQAVSDNQCGAVNH